MLDDSQQKISHYIGFYCCIIRHGRHVFCLLIPLGTVGNRKFFACTYVISYHVKIQKHEKKILIQKCL